MTEDEISLEMYKAAMSSDEITVLSWQGVGGKAYLTRDMRFRVGKTTQATDLVLLSNGTLWLIEVKSNHRDALTDDEPKLTDLNSQLGAASIRSQVAVRCKQPIAADTRIRFVVAYSHGQRTPSCLPGIGHIPWMDYRPSISNALMHA